MFSKTTISNLGTIAKHNMKYIDKINIEIFNPSSVRKSSLFRPTVYKSTIHFNKDNLYFYKEINSHNLDDLVNEIKETIASEIKV